MNKNLIRWLPIFALNFVPITLNSSSHAQMVMGPSGMEMGTTSMTALEKLSGRQFDIAWMSQMIAHHKGALEMAQKCLRTCEKLYVKKAATTIINVQTKEILQMKHWLKAWYAVAPDKEQMALMRGDIQNMMDSTLSGMVPTEGEAQADKAFLEGMIPHHQSAVDMAKVAVAKAVKSELKIFAQRIITDQSKEIKLFQSWFKKL